MNRIHSLVWNQALKTLQVTSELARAKRSGATGRAASSLRKHRLALACVAALALAAFAAPDAWAGTPPTGVQPIKQASPLVHTTGLSGIRPLVVKCPTNGCTGGTGGGDAAGGAGGAGGAGAGLTGTGYSGSGANGAAGAAGTGYSGPGTGGAGGAGGAPGDVFTSGGYLVGSDTGGAGQNGAAGSDYNNGGGGGGGGGGGAGAVFGGNIVVENSVTGGAGGNGGSGSNGGGGGGGGGGGVGVLLLNGTLTNLSHQNFGTITGGAGGSGAGNGSDGAGGVGVIALGNSTIVNPQSISGGPGGDGVTRADAVLLSGGGNTLVLENGYSFIGNVVSAGGVGLSAVNGGDTLALGGDTNGTFDLSAIAYTDPGSYTGTTQYAGFNNFEKTGTSTWTVTNSRGFKGGVTVSSGTLQVGDGTTATKLGGSSVNVVSGGTLSGFGIVDSSLDAATAIAQGGTLSPGADAGSIGSLLFEGTGLDMLGTLDTDINGTGSGNFDFVGVHNAATFGTTSFFYFMLGGDTSQQAGDSFQFFDANAFLNFADIGNSFSCSGLMSGLSCMLGMNTTGNGLFLRLDASGGGGGGTTSVPEPGSLGMMGFGLLLLGGGLGWRNWRDRKKA